MLSVHEVDKSLEHITPELRDIVLELRNMIAAVVPQATEVKHSKGFTFYDAQRGGPVSAGICQIVIEHDFVGLAFIHGAFLPDPKQLLEGERRYKKFVQIPSYADAPWEALRDLITASVQFNPRNIGESYAGNVSGKL